MMPMILNTLISGVAFQGNAETNQFSVGSLSGTATGYAKVGKDVIGGLGRRYGKKLSDRITKKSQDNPEPEFNIDAKDAAASNGESGGNRLSPKISSKPNGDENGGKF
jgi:hypothetical protein